MNASSARMGRLTAVELRLLTREPLAMVFVLAFPVVTVLVLGGVFAHDDPGFGGVSPSDHYIAAYFAVVIAAVGLVMVPVHVAMYHEHGVLRRFAATGFAPWMFPASQLLTGLGSIAVGDIAVYLTGALSYGVPPVHDPLLVAVGLLSGAVEFLVIGFLLGTLVPTARSAQAAGMLLFFPMFLLGGGGPPASVMPGIMRSVASLVPLGHVTAAVQRPWFGAGSPAVDLAYNSLTTLLVASTWAGLRIRRTRR